ncbi:MAG: hypothetical protein R2725_05975 [Solirubrobacterales bacterium]
MSERKYSADPAERARELVAEGKIGGRRRGAGRPRKHTSEAQQPPRAATVVAEAARANSDKIAKVFTDVLSNPESSDRHKVQAVKAMLGIEGSEEDRQRDERRDDRSPERPEIETREQALASLAESLSDPIVAERFSRLLASRSLDPE